MHNIKLSYVLQIYYQAPGDDAVAITVRHLKKLKSDEQPYERKLKVSKNWLPLEFGWIKEPSLIVVRNLGIARIQGVPTSEQKEAAEAAVLEYAIKLGDGVVPVALIAPTDCLPLVPLGDDVPLVRCRKGEVTCILTAYPK
jgi:hypothetical protein